MLDDMYEVSQGDFSRDEVHSDVCDVRRTLTGMRDGEVVGEV